MCDGRWWKSWKVERMCIYLEHEEEFKIYHGSHVQLVLECCLGTERRC
jgi:hypothetical protein